jgi:signal transduction histidine kinase/ligand-binding sensor domain-containing protein
MRALCLSAVAALLCLPHAVRAERLPIRTFGEEEGLPSTVQDILRDSRGLLWFATRDGIARFDGARFVVYGTEHGLPVPTAGTILESRDGSHWVVTWGAGGGLVRFDAGTVARAAAGARSLFHPYDGPLVYVDRAERRWIDAGDRLLAWDEADEGLRRRATMDPVPLSAARDASGVAEGPDGSLWTKRTCGLLRVTLGRSVCYPTDSRSGYVPVAVDHQGRVWFATAMEGVTVLRPGPWPSGPADPAEAVGRRVEAVAVPGRLDLDLQPGESRRVRLHGQASQDYVARVHVTRDGHVWLGTAGGLVEYDGSRFRRYTPAHGLADRHVGALAEDREGNVWFGTLAGAGKLSRGGFTSFHEADGLGHPRVYSLVEEAAGVVAVGTDWHLSRFDGARFHSVRPRLTEGLAPWLSQAAFLDRRGQWWILSRGGLARFPVSTRFEDIDGRVPPIVYGKGEGVLGEMPYRLFEDQQGDLWIGGLVNGGLSRWERSSGRITLFPETQRTGDDGPSALAQHPAGPLWVGFVLGGLMQLQGERFAAWPAGGNGPRGSITALHLDDAGRLWIGSNEEGVTRVDDPLAVEPRLTRYTIGQGLASNNVRCLTSDRFGRLYVGTARGVDRLDPATGVVRHYTTAEGLANGFTIAALRDREGSLWFGTAAGVSRLVPQPDRSPEAPPVWIGGLRIRGVPQSLWQLGQREVAGLELRADQNQLEIDFFGLGFAPGGPLRYQYTLAGTDRGWNPPTQERTVHYSRLAPGQYRFLVRALTADGTVSAEPASVAFRVLPPLWQRRWFQGLLAAAAVAAAYAAHASRLRRLLGVERVRTRIASDLHDDLGSSLSQIAVLSEVARLRVATGDRAETTSSLERIGGLSRASIDALGDIVWAIDPHKDRLLDLTQRLRGLVGDVLEPAGITYSFEAEPSADELRLGADLRREVFLVCKESLHNVVRHAQARRVDVRLTQNGGVLVLAVGDDGRGFDPVAPAAGTGLASMRRRARALGGRLEVVSAAGRGTRLELVVPLRRPRVRIRRDASGDLQ